jgi:hypothetical protein
VEESAYIKIAINNSSLVNASQYSENNAGELSKKVTIIFQQKLDINLTCHITPMK